MFLELTLERSLQMRFISKDNGVGLLYNLIQGRELRGNVPHAPSPIRGLYFGSIDLYGCLIKS